MKRNQSSNAISCLKCELDFVWDGNGPLKAAWRCLVCYTINADANKQNVCCCCKRQRSGKKTFVEKSYVALKCVVCEATKYFYDGFVFENCNHFHCVDCLLTTIKGSDTQIKCHDAECQSTLKVSHFTILILYVIVNRGFQKYF